jgi:hypothetical protein
MFSPRKLAASAVLIAVCSGGVALSALPANAATPATSASAGSYGQFTDGNFDATTITKNDQTRPVPQGANRDGYRAYLSAGASGWQIPQGKEAHYALDSGAWVHANSGKNYALLGSQNVPGLETNTIYQDVATVPGQTIVLNYSHISYYGKSTMNVSAGAPTGTLKVVSTATGDHTAWTKHSVTYTVPAGQTTTRFQFAGISDNSKKQVGNGLDSVSVALAPASAFSTASGANVVLNNTVANAANQRTVIWRNGTFDTEVVGGKVAFGGTGTSVANGEGISLDGYAAGERIVVTTESATYTTTTPARTVLLDTVIK